MLLSLARPVQLRPSTDGMIMCGLLGQAIFNEIGDGRHARIITGKV